MNRMMVFAAILLVSCVAPTEEQQEVIPIEMNRQHSRPLISRNAHEKPQVPGTRPQTNQELQEKLLDELTSIQTNLDWLNKRLDAEETLREKHERSRMKSKQPNGEMK